MSVSGLDVVRVTAKMLFNNSDAIQNVYHVESIVGNPQITDSIFLAGIEARLSHCMKQIDDHMSDLVSFDIIEAFNVTQGFPMGYIGWVNAPNAIASDAPMPPQVSAMVNFTTQYPNSVGRKYLGLFTEAANAGLGVIDGSVVGAIGNYVTELLTPMTFGGCQWHFGNYAYANPHFKPWQAGALDLIWSTQRRRKPGTGI